MTEPLLDRLPDVAGEIGAASHLLLCLDFDGTLAPIVPDPAEADMRAETRAVLEQLAEQPEVTVAVVSGRATEDLRIRVGLNVILAGNHGLEILERNRCWRHPTAVRWQPVLHEICVELAARAGEIPGAVVEDKGLTASLHYRHVAPTDLPLIAEIVNTAVAARGGRFFLRNGKKVFEILPRARWDKGSAILWILERVRQTQSGEIAVSYIGDDTTDERAFRQLPGAITVRVGKNCPTMARFRVRDTAQVSGFLHWLYRRIGIFSGPSTRMSRL